jgi:hypothetical protein
VLRTPLGIYFRAAPPLGKGTAIALVLPPDFPAQTFIYISCTIRSVTAKVFPAVMSVKASVQRTASSVHPRVSLSVETRRPLGCCYQITTRISESVAMRRKRRMPNQRGLPRR